MPNVGIVGGGMLGHTLALRLRQRGFDVTVFEAATSAGAFASPVRVGPYTWDRFYNPILLSDGHLHGLLDELNIAGRMRWGVTRTGFHIKGKLYSLSSAIDFLRFQPLSPIDKARLTLTILRAAHLRNPLPLESVSATDWLRRWSGNHAYENFWLPLLKAKLGDNHTKASAAFIRAIVARKFAARRTGLKREMFGYVEGGYSVILEALCGHLTDFGVQLKTNAAVARVCDSADNATITLKDGRVFTFDHAIVTTPAPLTVRLCAQLSDDERARLEKVTYQGIMCLSVLLRRPLGGAFHVTNIATPGMPFAAVIEMTALVPPGDFGGHTLVYLPRYLAQDDTYWALSDSTVRNRFLAGLGALYPRLEANDVVACEISRLRHALVVSTQNYSRDIMLPLVTSRPRILVVNSAQIAHDTLTANETVALANTQAERIAARLVPKDLRVHTPWPGRTAMQVGIDG